MEKQIKVLITIFTVALLVLTVGCTSNTGTKESSSGASLRKPVNILVIIDTSNRISKTKNPGQAEKDIQILESIVNIFEEKFVRPNLYIGSKDRLAFVVPRQPGVLGIPQKTLVNLKIWRTDKQRALGAPEFQKMKMRLIEALSELYQYVSKQNQFPGADIWSWFRDSAEVYLKPDAHNYIICLSDGYLDFNRNIQIERPKGTYIPYHQVVQFAELAEKLPDWKQKFHAEEHGLLEIGKDFTAYNVKFFMFEIRPRKKMEPEILKVYWQTWLESMGITDSQFWLEQDDPQTTIEKIKEFISPL